MFDDPGAIIVENSNHRALGTLRQMLGMILIDKYHVEQPHHRILFDATTERLAIALDGNPRESQLQPAQRPSWQP